MKTVDARGIPCPKPLILTKTAITNAALNEEIEVLIDDDVAFHNAGTSFYSCISLFWLD